MATVGENLTSAAGPGRPATDMADSVLGVGRPAADQADSVLGAARLADIQSQFPLLRRVENGRPIAYLDSAATSLTPQTVIDAIVDYYTNHRASVHRGVYPLSVEATDLFEGARERIAAWLGSTPQETIFTANASASLNLVAHSWGRSQLRAGDLVVVTEMEHHSNVVPWQLICAERGAELAYIPVLDDGQLDLDAYDALLERGPRAVCVTHVSNVLGTINPVAEIVAKAHDAGAITVIDGTQAVPQLPVNLPELDADFYAWAGHKAYGPTGIGVLHGRAELLEEMPPFISGGHMIRQVFGDYSTWAELPGKFEAGTTQIAEAIGLGAAVDFIREIGIDTIRAHELALTARALEQLAAEVPGITLHGPADPARRGAVVSFVLEGAHPHDIGEILGREGVCVRTGHHCAQPLMRCLHAGSTTRASFAVHNSTDDVDRLVAGLHSVRATLRL
ncbi:MAG: SufS family cysteine desulfurase [Solirubrobacteraceae bacterium]